MDNRPRKDIDYKIALSDLAHPACVLWGPAAGLGGEEGYEGG